MSTCDLDNYKCSDKGLLMPLVNEYTWNVGVRAFVYFMGLLWSFMGVSIVADIFMQAIETITSRTTTVKMSHPGSETGYREVEVKVWNNTVANLTLMALGSSAPEILLSVIEITGNTFVAGTLGPGTIVGSAAFNLFCITGICVFSIPENEVRRIHAFKVFLITSSFSVLAYVWLLVILVVITPDFIELWEAILTLCFFPILVTLAYIADKEFCCNKTKVEDSEKEFGLGESGKIELIGGKAKADQVVQVLKKIGHRSDLSVDDEARITTAILSRRVPRNRAWYRIHAIRNLTGGQKLVPAVTEKQAEIMKVLEEGLDVGSTVSLDLLTDSGRKAVVEWSAPATAVLERDGRAKLTIMRHGNIDIRVLIRVETIDGTAVSEEDYKPVKETVVLEPGQTSKDVNIEIIDDNEYEPDEIFFVRLSMDDPDQACVLGSRAITQVTIINDDAEYSSKQPDPGSFEFTKPSFVFKESAGNAMVEVKRVNGCDGTAKVSWETKEQTGKGAAISGRDFEGGSGQLIFQHGELTKIIEIPIIDDQDFEKDEHFDVILSGCSEGSSLGHLTRTVVTILNDDEFKGVVSRIVNLTNANLDQISVHKSSWSEQFRNAMNVNGGDLDTATSFDYVMHFLTFGWKLIFAMIPPPQIWGGWLSFFVSLGAIGALTAFVGDLASIFGCLIGLKDTVTAITLVALGTSLPDLFASKTAAVREEHADNSIGNVTGSNSVNVFLGLGLPWTIAAIYWSAKDMTFEVPAGNLSFSVILYAVLAVSTIIVLMVRRYVPALGKAELGGPTVPKVITAVIFCMFWVIYVLLSSLQAYDYIKTDL